VLVRPALLDEILALRHAVLRPGRPLDTARFAGDDEMTTVHVGVFDGTCAVGCATVMWRPLDDGEHALQLRGMATAPDRAGQGIGRAVLRYIEDDVARAAGMRVLWCNARTSASGFYAGAGWKLASTVFDVPDVGPHVRMIRRL
jgi:GNAT superfamily N-acetyltransferase